MKNSDIKGFKNRLGAGIWGLLSLFILTKSPSAMSQSPSSFLVCTRSHDNKLVMMATLRAISKKPHEPFLIINTCYPQFADQVRAKSRGFSQLSSLCHGKTEQPWIIKIDQSIPSTNELPLCANIWYLFEISLRHYLRRPSVSLPPVRKNRSIFPASRTALIWWLRVEIHN